MRRTLAAGSLRQILILFPAQSTVFPSKLSARLFVYHSVPTCLDVNALRSILKCFSVILKFPGLYMWICMHTISQQEESIFGKGKICFEHRLSYIDTEVIKANLWFKSRGYYNETLRALSPSKEVFLYTHTTHRHKNRPRNSSQGSKNSLCRCKTKYPRASKIILHYFRSILYLVFSHTTKAFQSCTPAAPSRLSHF